MITKKWLETHCVCGAGVKWFEKNVHDDIEISALVEKLMLENRFSLANWLLANNLNKGHNIKYAVFAARQVLSIYEKEYPEDKRPREAIELAEGYLRCPSQKTAHETYAAAHEAYAAAYKAHQDYAAVASHAAYAAAYAAYAAIETIDESVDKLVGKLVDKLVDKAVKASIDAPTYTTERIKLEKAIIDFGLTLLNRKEN